MREEIAAAVVFLSRLVRKNDNISKEKIDKFSNHLSAILVEKFKNHWYKDQPTKGQGYRCIRINPFEPIDPILEKAAIDSGLNIQELQLPIELTLWVDPSEVCCRFGESHGSFCTLAESRDGNLQNRAHTINIEELLEKERERHNQQINIVTTRSKGQSHNNHFSRGLMYGGNANFYNKHQHNYYRNKNGTQQQKQQNVNKNEVAKRESSQTTASDRESPEHINEIRQQFLNQVNNVIAGKSSDDSTSKAMPKSSSPSSSTPPPTQETKPQVVAPPSIESATKEISKQSGENKKEDPKQSHSNASPMQSRSNKGGKNSQHGNNSSSPQQQKNKQSNQNGHSSHHQKSPQHQENSSSSSTTNHWNKASTASQGRYQRSQ
ncbi:hypothetical protein KUTeg_001065 [Tegillarca granosa]|uniref:Anti-proliferative protein domain-containing protein n=1 Tax=Tegillarca granosa TaxID=220873 RepID=A0ABQ9FVW1_TEGGR|nr:hypothetical protein KUTeg_001065 [Tegillarca granosa]